MVRSGGFEALAKLSSDGLKYIAPLPVEFDPELACYKYLLSMEGGPMGHAGENLPKAQSIKDATMAHSIVKYKLPDNIFIHFNGSYHSDRYMGIIWYLNKCQPGLKIITITTILRDDIDRMGVEGNGKADFVIVIPSSMKRTYK
jgi:uncharacterized iron-regulated protein